MVTESFSPSPTLTDFSAGALGRADRLAQRFLAPIVQVPTLIGRYKKWNCHMRNSVANIKRSLRGHAVQVERDALTETYECSISGLDYPIDRVVGKDLEWLAEDAVALLADIEADNTALEVIDLAVQAAGAGSAMTWGAGDDPISLLDEQIRTLMKAAASPGCGVAFGPEAWAIFKNHAAVRDRVGAPNWDQFPGLLQANAEYHEITALRAVNQAPDDTLDFAFPTASVMIFARVPNPTRRDPSFMKTFRLTQKAFPPAQIVPLSDGRRLLVRQDWAQDVRVTNPLGVARFNISTS